MPTAPRPFRLPHQQDRKTVEKGWASRRNGNHGLYNLWIWRKPGGIREQVLRRDPLCAWCKTSFMKVTPSKIADHITPHDGDMTLFYSMENIQGLCESCHNRKTRVAMNHGKRVVVSGPPGCGKTTYVTRHRSRDAVVWDADDIVKTMTGRGRREWPECMMSVIPAMLDGFAKAVTHTDVGELWVIVSEQRRASEIARMIDAEHVELGEQ